MNCEKWNFDEINCMNDCDCIYCSDRGICINWNDPISINCTSKTQDTFCSYGISDEFLIKNIIIFLIICIITLITFLILLCLSYRYRNNIVLYIKSYQTKRLRKKSQKAIQKSKENGQYYNLIIREEGTDSSDLDSPHDSQSLFYDDEDNFRRIEPF